MQRNWRWYIQNSCPTTNSKDRIVRIFQQKLLREIGLIKQYLKDMILLTNQTNIIYLIPKLRFPPAYLAQIT